MIEIKAFQCEFCNKVLKDKRKMEFHINNCYKNPDVRVCYTCRFYKKDFETVYNPYHGGTPGSNDYDTPVFWCDIDSDNPIDLWKEDGPQLEN